MERRCIGMAAEERLLGGAKMEERVLGDQLVAKMEARILGRQHGAPHPPTATMVKRFGVRLVGAIGLRTIMTPPLGLRTIMALPVT